LNHKKKEKEKKHKQPLPLKESFPAEDNFDLQRLPVKTLMLILQLLHREVSILLRTRAKEGGGISPQGERIDLEPVLLLLLFPFLSVEGLAARSFFLILFNKIPICIPKLCHRCP
jgi:hypothetical protein